MDEALFSALRLCEQCFLIPKQTEEDEWVIGYNHNMSKPLTNKIAELILKEDIHYIDSLYETLPENSTGGLSNSRRVVLKEIIYRLGIDALYDSGILKALEYKSYEKAAELILNLELPEKRITILATKMGRGY